MIKYINEDISIRIDDATGLPVLPEGKVWRFDDVYPKNPDLYSWGSPPLSGYRVHYGHYVPGETSVTEQEVYRARTWWGKKELRRRNITRQIDNPEPVFIMEKCDLDVDLTDLLYGPAEELREAIAERALQLIVKERKEEIELGRMRAALESNKARFVGEYPPRSAK